MGLKHTVPKSRLITHHLIILFVPEWVSCPSFTKKALMFLIKAVSVERMPTCSRTKTQFHMRIVWSKCEEQDVYVQLVLKHSPSGPSHTRKASENQKHFLWTSLLSLRCLPSVWDSVSIFLADLNIRAL